MRRFKGRRSFRRPVFRRRRRFGTSTSRRLAVLERRQRAQVQYKNIIHTGLLTDAWSTTPIFFALNEMKIGTSEGLRIGDRITMTGITVKVFPQFNNGVQAGAGFAPVRCVMWVDRTPDGLAPPRDLLFATPGAAPNDTDAFFAPINRLYKGRFKILYDKTWDLNINALFANDAPLDKAINVVIRRKLPNIVTTYYGDTGGAVDIQRNALGIAVFQQFDTSIPAPACAAVNLTYQLEYTC